MHCMSIVYFLGSVDARTWRRYRLYGPRMGPTDNFSLVTGPMSYCVELINFATFTHYFKLSISSWPFHHLFSAFDSF